jgi:hypothetical protein
MPIAINGSGTITGISAGGLPDAIITPAELTQSLTLGTAQASTAGTEINFTGIPSWAKRVTVMFDGVSLSGVSHFLIQIGAGSIQSTGYLSSAGSVSNSTVSTTTGGASTSGLILLAGLASALFSGSYTISLFGSNKWCGQGVIGGSAAAGTNHAGGAVTLSGTLDRVRITTVNGTDTFDAGTINILYE